jgi:hypothetical protein
MTWEKIKEEFLSRITAQLGESAGPTFLFFRSDRKETFPNNRNSAHHVHYPSTVLPSETKVSSVLPKEKLSCLAVKLLAHVALNALCFVTQRYNELGLNLAEGKKTLEELVGKGFIRLHRIPRIGRGGQYQALEILEAGKALLAEKGITVEPLVLKGGYRHSFYGRLIGRWADSQKYKYSFERKLGQKEFDLVLELPAGEMIGVEIILTGSSPWNVSQLIKAAEVRGVSQVYVVCESRELRDRLKEDLDKYSLSQEMVRKVRFFLCAEFIGTMGWLGG